MPAMLGGVGWMQGGGRRELPGVKGEEMIRRLEKGVLILIRIANGEGRSTYRGTCVIKVGFKPRNMELPIHALKVG